MMRFTQLDRILTLEKSQSITAVKCLALSEEYLQDHFPRFPIMPGVLMLESMFQASEWLLRASLDFAYANVVLNESKSLKFQGFVQPGDSLHVTAQIKSLENQVASVKVDGSVNGQTATSGRLVLEAFNLADREGVDPAIDQYMNHQKRLMFRRLCNQVDPESPYRQVKQVPLI